MFFLKNFALSLSNVRSCKSSNQEAFLKNTLKSSFFVRLHGVKNAALIKMNSFVDTFQRLCVYVLMINWRSEKQLFSRTPSMTASELLMSYEKRIYS